MATTKYTTIQHCFDLPETSRGRQEDLHTQFARRMVTKVVVAITWLPVGIVFRLPEEIRNAFDLLVIEQ